MYENGVFVNIHVAAIKTMSVGSFFLKNFFFKIIEIFFTCIMA